MKLIRADWDVSPRVRAFSTTRHGGISVAPFDSLNLGDHVDDDPAAVAQNRQRLLDHLGIAQPAQWLKQVHGTAVVQARCDRVVREADACITDQPGQACVVMTADCLPVFFTDHTRVGVAHAGWRGLADGVLEATLNQFPDPSSVHCWLGPAIGPQAFEVGDEVREAFIAADDQAAAAFQPGRAEGKWWADLYQLARLRLNAAGVASVAGGEHCTFTEGEDFFSYRRDGQTGRMAHLIWLED